jgi:hypothetical protein
MAVRRTFDDDFSGDEQAPGQYEQTGPRYDNTRFGGYSARVEQVPGPDGQLHPVEVGTSRGDYVDRYRGLGTATANREAYQLDYNAADQDRERGLQAREGQVQAAGMMRDAAMGNAPSRAAIMAQGGLDTGMHSMLQAQGRGLAGAAYAQRQAMMQGQQQQLGAIGQTGAARADELGSAQDAYTRGASAIRNGDYGSQYQAQQQARQQMLMELEQRQRNQQQQQAYEGLAFGVNKAEQEADLAKRQGYLQRDAASTAGAGLLKGGGGEVTGSNPDPTTTSDARSKQHAYMLSDDRTKLAEAYQLGKAHAAASISTGQQVPNAYEPGDAVLKRGKAASKIRGNAKVVQLAQQPQVTTQEEVNQAALARAHMAAQQAAQKDEQMAPDLRSRADRVSDYVSDRAGDIYDGTMGWLDSHVSDERAKGDVVALYEPPGQQLHMGDDGRARYVSEEQQAPSGASLSGPAPRYGTAPPKSAIAAASAKKQRPMTDDEMMKAADALLAKERADHEKRMAQGPAVRRVERGSSENGYTTQLNPDAERGFQDWRQRTAPWDTGQDYDLRGAYADGIDRDANGHLPDTYKKPNHETFSDESDYARGNEDIAGRWEGDRYQSKGPPRWLRQSEESRKMGDALEKGLAPYRYEYKPGFREQEEQKPGEKNVGPMAQNMASNPITGTAVKQAPNGLMYIDMPKATKLSLGGIGYLAQQQRATEERLRRLEKGRG